MNANAKLRIRIEEIQSKVEPEREWWSKRREELQAEFMKELDVEGNPKESKPKHIVATTNLLPPLKPESVASSIGSDEDGVLVEEGGSSSPTTPPQAPGQTGSKKKKRNKK